MAVDPKLAEARRQAMSSKLTPSVTIVSQLQITGRETAGISIM